MGLELGRFVLEITAALGYREFSLSVHFLLAFETLPEWAKSGGRATHMSC